MHRCERVREASLLAVDFLGVSRSKVASRNRSLGPALPGWDRAQPKRMPNQVWVVGDKSIKPRGKQAFGLSLMVDRIDPHSKPSLVSEPDRAFGHLLAPDHHLRTSLARLVQPRESEFPGNAKGPSAPRQHPGRTQRSQHLRGLLPMERTKELPIE